MANNLVFNNVADQLKTKVYGDNSGTTKAIAVDSDGKLLVGEIGTVTTIGEVLNVQSVDLVDAVSTVSTVSQVLNVASVDAVDAVSTVSTVSQVLNVASVDAVDAVSTVSTVSQVLNVASVDAVDAVSTVSTVSQVLNVASVDAVDAVSTVSTVSEVLNVASVDAVDAVSTVTYVSEVKSITDTVNINVVGNGFVHDIGTAAAIAAGNTVTVLTKDTSEVNVTSFYIKRTGGSGTVETWLQISPTNVAADYIDDPYVVTLTDDTPTILDPQRYLKYTRVRAKAIGDTATVVARYNGHY
ncbi:DUF6385 domain-containing protein [Crassaminicella profunda]|uniref:DUF6385 domain-containing protein n=1 Tax=Crassaminicella profunda TaxID=1286698 RepID=UPI001CA66543|nr:DUF6385 domain-containing protein [Crassaminicella profunda]QZY56325.1 DUF6385 domain-containing protein [Crassaminicella profunda]